MEEIMGYPIDERANGPRSGGAGKPAVTPCLSDDDYAEIAKFQLKLLKFQLKIEEVLGSFEISLRQFQALLIIKTFPGPELITIRGLSTAMAVHPSSTSGLVARLETAGLVERNIDLEDRRIIRVQLTAKGESLLAEIVRRDMEHARELRENFLGMFANAIDV